MASQHAQHVQPLSPLTLGELGLQPPETPSALIDITPSKTAIVHSSTSRNDRSATNRTHLKVYSTAQLAGPGGPDADSSFNGRAQTGNASHFTSGMASTDASANASSESIEDPLLAKFLQSLVDDGSTLTEPTSTTESYSNAESSPPSLLPTSTAPRPASTLDRFPSMQLTPPMRRAVLQRTALPTLVQRRIAMVCYPYRTQDTWLPSCRPELLLSMSQALIPVAMRRHNLRRTLWRPPATSRPCQNIISASSIGTMPRFTQEGKAHSLLGT